MSKRKLTARQRAFVLEFPKDFNATKSAERAKYSPKSARQIGSENLSKPYIRAAIEREYEKMSMSLEEALARIAAIARGKLPEGTIELKAADVRKALDTVLKHHGALIDRLAVDWKFELLAKGLDPDEVMDEIAEMIADKIAEKGQ